MATTAGDATHQAIEATWRTERAKLVAGVARVLRDVWLAEEMAQEALVAALEHWPRRGVPNNPGAWLMATAKNRALDHLRHEQMRHAKHEQIGHELDATEALIVPDFVDALDAARADTIGDDLLRLIFIACHPVLSLDARVALTLKLLGGLSTAEIARAFLAGEPTIAQRIVRAKRTLSDAKVPFELPRGEALTARLDAVLEVIYLIFNEGYSATGGDEWMRPALCDEALRLGRLLATLAAPHTEVHGLLALMELQASRAAARIDAQGAPVLLPDQDRSRWDHLQIGRGVAALQRATAAGEYGVYTLQAAIAACHAHAAAASDTDWPRIVSLYDELLARSPSPVIALNRAVAISMAQGPAEALALVDALRNDRTLKNYHWLPSVRADLLLKLGRSDEARREFETAAAMAGNARERDLLRARAAALCPRG